MSAKTAGGRRVVRFGPVFFCAKCNAKDGHGKLACGDPNKTWYSMATSQLTTLADKKASWNDLHRGDQAALAERVEAVDRLVAVEIARHDGTAVASPSRSARRGLAHRLAEFSASAPD